MKGFKRSKMKAAAMLLVAGVCVMAQAAELFAPDRFTMLNIVPMRAGEERAAAADAKAYAQATGQKVVLYSLTLHPQGFPASNKVDRAVASYRAFAKHLKGSDVMPGILLQAIIGHWTLDQVHHETENWQRTINVKGAVCRWCPLDPGYRAYIRETAQKLAAEKPCVILSDDDVRSFSPLAECFCPLHVAAYNKKLRARGLPEVRGTEEMRARVAAANISDGEHAAFSELQQETIESVCRAIRAGIDAVDPSLPAGVCQPGWSWERERVVSYARAIAAKGQMPFLRLANGRYYESAPKVDVPADTIRTLAEQAKMPDDVLLLDEADTYPHNPWSKSAVAFHAKMALGAFCGLNGAKTWYVGAHKQGEPISRDYTAILAKHRGYYDALVRVANATVPTGIAIPVHPESPSNPVSVHAYPYAYDAQGWAANVFGIYGIPFRATTNFAERAVFALSGEADTGRFTDEQLRTILKGRVLIDGNAARALIARGLGNLIGVTLSGKEGGYTAERREDTGAVMANPLSTHMPIFKAHPAARVLSSLIWQPYGGAAQFERIAPSAICFENSEGGRVLVTAFTTTMPYDKCFSDARQKWHYALLESLAEGLSDNVCCNGRTTLALTRKGLDDSDYVFVINANCDPAEEVCIRRRHEPIGVEVLQNDGTWRGVSCTWRDGALSVPLKLACYDAGAIRLRKAENVQTERARKLKDLWYFAEQHYFQDRAQYVIATNVVRRAAAAGYTGCAFITGRDNFGNWSETTCANDGSKRFVETQAGVDAWWRMTPARRARMVAFKQACDAANMDCIPLVWSVGYGSMNLDNPNRVAAWPSTDVPYEVKGGVAQFAGKQPAFNPTPFERIGGAGEKRAAHVAVTVTPHRRYRFTAEIKTAGVAEGFEAMRALTFGVTAGKDYGERSINLLRPMLEGTQDWTPIDVGFSSGNWTNVIVHVNGRGRVGTFKLRNVRVEAVGIEYPVRRAGTPFVVRDAQTGRVYEEGRDYAPVASLKCVTFSRPEQAVTLKMMPGGAISEGARLLVSAYEPVFTFGVQTSSCLENPELYDYFDKSAAALTANLQLKKWFLSLDEIRVECHCELCQKSGKTMGERLAACVTRQREIIKGHVPDAEIFMWSDMPDTAHNAAKTPYYLCDTPFAGAFEKIPKDVVMVPWWGAKCETVVASAEKAGFPILGGAFYDCKTHESMQTNATRWVKALMKAKGARGIMYTTWQNGRNCGNYQFLEDFAHVVRDAEGE